MINLTSDAVSSIGAESGRTHQGFEDRAMRAIRGPLVIRRAILTVAFTVLALSYVGSYYRLSRRALREAPLYGVPGFLYVPFKELPEDCALLLALRSYDVLRSTELSRPCFSEALVLRGASCE